MDKSIRIADPKDDSLVEVTPKAASSQLLHSALGEVVGLSVSLGAVYVANHMFPGQTKWATKKIAERLGTWRGTAPTEQLACASKIMDVTLMNIGGISNMATQFTLHRHATNPEDRQPLGHDIGRLLAGRVAGTVTSIGSLAFAQKHMPSGIGKSERRISDVMGKGPAAERFAELFISDIIQSIGAIPGNVSAQLLYDQIVGNAHKR